MLRPIVAFALVLVATFAAAEPPRLLPGTQPLEGSDPLDVRMMDGLHTYIERHLAESVAKREQFWKRDRSSPEAYRRSIEPNRTRFLQIIGAVDPLPAQPELERFGDGQREAVVATTPDVRIVQVRWRSFADVWAEGLLIEPATTPQAHLVLLPDADQTPEQCAGLAPGASTVAGATARLARAGVRILIPTLVDRQCTWSGREEIALTNQTHREWIYRQAYHMGRHIIGFEVQKTRAALSWLASTAAKSPRLAVAGYGEGGLIALYTAASSPEVTACLTSGYFEPREQSWREPLYRNVWSLLCEFGDAEIAAMVAPRSLVIEHSIGPAVAGPPAAGPSVRKLAAVGELRPARYESVAAEYQRLERLVPGDLQKRCLVSGSNGATVGPFGDEALAALAQMLGLNLPPAAAAVSPAEMPYDPAPRQRRQVRQLEDHVQRLVRGSDRVRDEFLLWKVAPAYDPKLARWTTDQHLPELRPERLVEVLAPYKRIYWEEVLGKLPTPLAAPHPRTRVVQRAEEWTAYEVVLDVFDEVFAWGWLVLPNDLRPGERRPVVVCQHGRNGLPDDTLRTRAYYEYASRLAEEGFIVYSPHNPYRGEDRYRLLSRKANGLKASLFSFILAQHDQLLRWLATRPEVDAKRIAFYGLSYGGETAVRVPPLLDGYCLSICSGDFNDWARKVASTDSKFSFMYSIEWEMPYFNMGSTFNYAEMAYLMLPRPFMAERGHYDGVAPDEWVAYEYAKVRRLYDVIGLNDRTAIEFFNGGHAINCNETFAFLRKHLQWPPAR